jgi:hypothetical protein
MLTLFFKWISLVVNIAEKFIFVEPMSTGGNVLDLVAFQLGRE